MEIGERDECEDGCVLDKRGKQKDRKAQEEWERRRWINETDENTVWKGEIRIKAVRSD